MNDALIKECKTYVNSGDLSGLQSYYTDLQNTEFLTPVNWQLIYQKVYLHACLKKQKEIADWLTHMFSTFDQITQIAMRQLFPYGRYLLAK